MAKVEELVGQMHTILQELLRIEKEANEIWKEHTRTLNELDHEMEIVPLNAPQLVKVASFRVHLRKERRFYKDEWYCAKAFNENFGTQRVLNSMPNARQHLRRQIRAGENVIKNNGLIAEILAIPKPTKEIAQAVEVEAAMKEVAAGKEVE